MGVNSLPKTRLRFETGPFCAWVQHANHSATEPAWFPVNRPMPSGSSCDAVHAVWMWRAAAQHVGGIVGRPRRRVDRWTSWVERHDRRPAGSQAIWETAGDLAAGQEGQRESSWLCVPLSSVVVKTSCNKTKTNTKTGKWDIKQVCIAVNRKVLNFHQRCKLPQCIRLVSTNCW